MITVLGATGNTGSRVATRLLARGVPVRAVGRDADRLRAAVPGAEPRVGDARDEAFLRTAFDGADAAVEELLRPATGVTVREVLGAADHTVVDVVTGIGRALGTPVHYVRVPDDELEKALLDVGLPADVARLQVAMNRAFDDGRVRPLAGRGPATTTSTTLAHWIASAVAP